MPDDESNASRLLFIKNLEDFGLVYTWNAVTCLNPLWMWLTLLA